MRIVLSLVAATGLAAAFFVPASTARPLPPATAPAALCTNYCTPGTSTNGCTATMSCSGNPSLSNCAGFIVTASNVEGMKNGVIRYGLASNAAPFAGGSTSFVCVKAPMQKTGVQNSGGTGGSCDGSLSLDFLAYICTHPNALGMPFVAGTTLYAQATYKDPPAVKSLNLSDGLEFTIVP